MDKRTFLSVIITGLIALAAFSMDILVPDARAQLAGEASSSQVGPVTKVEFDTGYFEKNARGDWDEYLSNGMQRFPFSERAVTRDSVILRNDLMSVDIEMNLAKGPCN